MEGQYKGSTLQPGSTELDKIISNATDSNKKKGLDKK